MQCCNLFAPLLTVSYRHGDYQQRKYGTGRGLGDVETLESLRSGMSSHVQAPIMRIGF